MFVVQRIHHALGWLLVVLVVVLVGSVTWQVLSRYMFAVPAAWTEELARFVLIWIGLLGAAYAYYNHEHIAFDVLSKRLSGTRRVLLQRFIHVCCAAFALGVLVLGGGALMKMTWELNQLSAAMALPVAAVYAVIPASGALICLFALARIVSPSTEVPD